MPLLKWDEPGERLFATGVSKGVLYKSTGFGVSWNGLTSVDADVTDSSESVYFDGIKYADIITYGEFLATLRAFTYPDEFAEYEGVVEDRPGFYLFNQTLERFGLSYQTVVGNDQEGTGHGYQIHILYNLLAIPTQRSFKTLSDNVEPIEFEWDIKGIPTDVPGYRPTSHLVIDSTKIDPYLLRDIETILYGVDAADLVITNNHDGTWTAYSPDTGIITVYTDETFSIISHKARYINPDTYIIRTEANDAYLPSMNSLINFIRTWERLIITDNHNGTWTARSRVPGQIQLLPNRTFQITTDTAEYIDANTYTITSSAKEDNDIWLPPIPPLP